MSAKIFNSVVWRQNGVQQHFETPWVFVTCDRRRCHHVNFVNEGFFAGVSLEFRGERTKDHVGQDRAVERRVGRRPCWVRSCWGRSDYRASARGRRAFRSIPLPAKFRLPCAKRRRSRMTACSCLHLTLYDAFNLVAGGAVQQHLDPCAASPHS